MDIHCHPDHVFSMYFNVVYTTSYFDIADTTGLQVFFRICMWMIHYYTRYGTLGVNLDCVPQMFYFQYVLFDKQIMVGMAL